METTKGSPVDLEVELPAVTGGSTGGHRRGRYPTRVSDSLRYWWTKAIAMLPSPTAAATRFTGPRRTSPHAKTPGTLVSRRYGSRSSSQRSARRDPSP